PEPVPLSMSNCSIRAGTQIETMEYIELLGFYPRTPDLDTIPDLRNSYGQNETLEFSDMNDDGYLDDGDTFTLHNLTRPDSMSSAQTYLLMVDRDLYPEEGEREWGPPKVFLAYIIMTSEGVLWVTDAGMPYAASYQSIVEDGVAVTIDFMSNPVCWEDLILLVSDGEESVQWHIDATALSTGTTAYYSCGVTEIDEMFLECVVADSTGNGFLDVGDQIELLGRDGTHLNDIEYLSIACIYSPMDTEIFYELVQCGSVPVSECAFAADDHSVAITFNPVHNGTGYDYELIDATWNDVVITIGYGETQVEWNPDISYLDGGEPASWISNGTQCGNLTLVCRVVDLQGNGLVNTGDAIEVIVTLGDGFSSDTEYSLSIGYTPTDSDIYSAAFTG
ncbi:MAG: hypothetical protein MUO84_05460, partial [Thermoplasmata archaeon]|nr:hypothetical protein [Thermoplasmata archaeon]